MGIRGETEVNMRLPDSEMHRDLSGAVEKKYFFIRAALKGICRLAAVLPERVTYTLCTGLAMLGYHLVPAYRTLARQQLETAFGREKTPREINEILRRCYRNHGANLAEFLMIPHKSAEWVNRKIKLDDPGGALRAEHGKGRGVVAAGAHMGNIEMVCAWMGVNGLPLVAVAKAQRDELFTKFLTDARRRWGSEIIFKARGVKEECMRQLAQGKVVGLVADQNAARGGVFVNFFGEAAATPAGPAYIAMKAGLPIVPGFVTSRNPDYTLTLHVLEPIPMRDTGDFESDLVHNVQLYTSALESLIRRYPSEYLWWHQRWKTRPE